MFHAVLSLVSIAIVGCIPHEEVVALADLDGAKLSLRIANDGTEVAVRLRNHVNQGGTLCTVVEERVSATLDGVPLEVISRGAYEPPPTTSAAADCTLPTFRAVTTPGGEPTSQIELTDGTTTITAVVQGLRMPRSFALAGELHAGADARFVWSVASDAVEERVQTRTPGVYWVPDQGTGFAATTAAGTSPIRIDGTALVVSVPENATTGDGMFGFSDLFTATFTRCEGITGCEAPAIEPPPLRATLSP